MDVRPTALVFINIFISVLTGLGLISTTKLSVNEEPLSTSNSSLTVTVTVEVPVAPLLSVTVRRKTYVPATRPVILVRAADELTIVAAPPDTFVQAYLLILPSLSVPLPVSVTLFVGKVMV